MQQTRERVKALLAALSAETLEGRDEAAAALREIDDPDAIPALIEGLTLTGRAGSEAIRGLARFGPLAHEAAPALCNLMADQAFVNPAYPSIRVRKRCRDALVCIGEAAVAPLIELLAHDDVHVKCRAATALGDIGDTRAVEPLTTLLLDGPPLEPHIVRKATSYALHRLGAIEQVLPRLQTLYNQLQETWNWTQAHECYYHFYIVGLTAPTPEAWLQHEHSGIHHGALKAIIEQRRREAVPTLLQMLDDPGQGRYGVGFVFEALGALKATEAIEPLERLTTGPNGSVRHGALTALGQIGDPKAVPALVACTKDPVADDNTKQAAILSLGHIGGFAATQQLLSYAGLGHVKPIVYKAVEALQRLPKHQLHNEERFVLLRELLSYRLGYQAWSLLCAYLARWPERDDKQIAIDYADEHMNDVDDLVRVIPPDWWEDCLNTRHESAWSLVRHLKLIESKDDLEHLRVRLMHPNMATVTHVTLQKLRLDETIVATLASSPYLKGLRFLDLSRCQVSDDVAFALAGEPFFSRLKTLRLIDLRFSRRARKALRDAAHLKRVRVVT